MKYTELCDKVADIRTMLNGLPIEDRLEILDKLRENVEREATEGGIVATILKIVASH